MNEKDRLTSIKEAAGFLGVSEKTLRRWENKGILLPLRTKGGHRRYKLSNLKDIKQKKGKHNLTQNILDTKPQQKIQEGIVKTIARPKSPTPIEYKEIISNLYKETPPTHKRIIKSTYAIILSVLIVILGSLLLPPDIKNLGKNSVEYLIKNSIDRLSGKKGYVEDETKIAHLKERVSKEKEALEKVLAASSFDNMLFSVNIESKFSEDSNFYKDVYIEGNQTVRGNQVIGNGTPVSIDLVAGDLFASGELEVAGDLYGSRAFLSESITVGYLIIGDDTFTNLTGPGLVNLDGVLTTTLGETVDSIDITDRTILEVDLNVSNIPTSGYVLTYNADTGGFTWAADQVGEGGGSLWTDAGTITYLTSITDNLALGGTSSSAPFYFDVSTGNLTISGNFAVNGGAITSTSGTLVINAGGNVDIQDNLTVNSLTTDTGGVDIVSGQDLIIGSIGLSSTGLSNITSGASLVGVFDEFANSTATTVQGVLADLDSAIGIGGSKWSQSTDFIYLANTTDSVTIGGTTELAKLAIDGDADEIQFLVQSHSTQTADLVVFEQSDGTDIFVVDSDGNLNLAGSMSIGTLAAGTTDSVITHDSGVLQARTIDSRVWSGDFVEAFTDLTDTPSDYTGYGNYLVRVTGAANGLEFVDAASVGTNYWDRDSGVLSPITQGDVIAATSGATTVATFTATGSVDALRAGGASSYLTVDNSGNITLPSTGFVGLGSSAGRITFTDAATDVVSVAGATLDIGGNANITGAGAGTFTQVNVNSLTLDGNTLSSSSDLDLTSSAGGDINLTSAGSIFFSDANVATPIPFSLSDSGLNIGLTQGVIDAINDIYDIATGGTGTSGFFTKSDNLIFPTLYWADSFAIGGDSTASAAIIFNTDGSAVFNQQGAAVDFRVEGDTDANLLFAQGSTDRVGIRTSTPQATLDVNGNLRIGTLDVGATDSVITHDSGVLQARTIDSRVWSGDFVEAFTDLTDTPSDYTGYGNYLVRVTGAANGLEFVDAASVGTNYWDRDSGVLSPITQGDVIAATSGATTVATFTATGSVDALRAGGASSYLTVDNSGNITLPSTGFVGLGSSAGRITFTDAATDVVSVAGATLDIGGNASITGAGVGTFTQVNVDDIRLDGNTVSITTADTALNVTANGTGLLTLQSGASGDIRFFNANNFITSSGNLTIAGDLAVNGADITTSSVGTATIFNTNATTLNIGGAATTVNIGAATGSTNILNNLDVAGSATVGTLTGGADSNSVIIDGGSGILRSRTIDSRVWSGDFVEAFTDLTDTPSDYTSYGNYLVRVTGAANGLEFVDPGSVGTNYWDRDSGVLSPITQGDVIAATSGATTVATFTATGSVDALRAGGASSYLTVDNSGNITLPSTGFVGLGSSAGRITFTDAATDVVSVAGATLDIGGNANITGAGAGTFTQVNVNSLTLDGNTLSSSSDLDLTSSAGGDINLTSAGSIFFSDANVATPIPFSLSDSGLNIGLTQGVIDAINDIYDIATGGTGTSGFFTKSDNLIFPTLYWADSFAIGGDSTASAAIIFNTDGSAVFNQQGAAVDFRVEGDTDANLLFAQGSTDRVGIRTSTPQATLDVNGNLRIGTLDVGATDSVITHDSGVLQARTIDSRVWSGDFVEAFTDLTDTPSDYTGYGNYLVRVTGAANGLEFVDAASVGTNYWDRDSGVLSPITQGDVIAATSGATTVATFTATGSVDALRAGGASSYLTVDNSGNITLPSTGFVGLGSSAGRITFTDAATDVVSVAGATLDIGGNANITGAGVGTLTSLNLTDNTNQVVLGTTTLGTLTMAGLSEARTWTFPNLSGTFALLENAQTFTGLKTFSAGLTVTSGQTFTLGGEGFTSLTGNGLAESSGVLTISLLDVEDSVGLTFSRSGLEFGGPSSDQLTLLQGCSAGQILKWSETNHRWECSADEGSGVGTSKWTEQNNLLYPSNAATLSVAIGTTTESDMHGLFTVSGTRTGRALAVFNDTGSDQNIITASASGTTVFNLDRYGNLELISPVADADRLKLVPYSAGDNTFTGTLTSVDLTDNQTWTFPDETGIVCLSSGNCSGTSGGSKWTDAGTFTYLTDTTDSVTIGSDTLELGKLGIVGDANEIQLAVRGHSTQTANLIVFEQSDGTDLFTLDNTGNLTIAGDLAVNGADITTSSVGTATIFNTNATTLNIGGAATTVNIGAATGSTNILNNLDVAGSATVGTLTGGADSNSVIIDGGSGILRSRTIDSRVWSGDFVEAFTDLTDTPSDYTGYGNYLVRVTGAANGLEFVDPGSVGTNYWDRDSGVLSPITQGDVIAATSGATTVATFTAGGTNLALRAGGSASYLTIDNSGNITLPDSGFIGLGGSAGRITFTDAATLML
jgi:hypothetical protein